MKNIRDEVIKKIIEWDIPHGLFTNPYNPLTDELADKIHALYKAEFIKIVKDYEYNLGNCTDELTKRIELL